jgi:hypothetical protein
VGVVEQPAGDIAEQPQPSLVQRPVALAAARWGAGDPLREQFDVSGGLMTSIRKILAGFLPKEVENRE